jgi:hypothetical protein
MDRMVAQVLAALRAQARAGKMVVSGMGNAFGSANDMQLTQRLVLQQPLETQFTHLQAVGLAVEHALGQSQASAWGVLHAVPRKPVDEK